MTVALWTISEYHESLAIIIQLLALYIANFVTIYKVKKKYKKKKELAILYLINLLITINFMGLKWVFAVFSTTIILLNILLYLY